MELENLRKLAYPGREVHDVETGVVRMKREEGSGESAVKRMRTAEDASTSNVAQLARQGKVKQVPVLSLDPP